MLNKDYTCCSCDDHPATDLLYMSNLKLLHIDLK